MDVTYFFRENGRNGMNYFFAGVLDQTPGPTPDHKSDWLYCTVSQIETRPNVFEDFVILAIKMMEKYGCKHISTTPPFQFDLSDPMVEIVPLTRSQEDKLRQMIVVHHKANRGAKTNKLA